MPRAIRLGVFYCSEREVNTMNNERISYKVIANVGTLSREVRPQISVEIKDNEVILTRSSDERD